MIENLTPSVKYVLNIFIVRNNKIIKMLLKYSSIMGCKNFPGYKIICKFYSRSPSIIKIIHFS